MVPGTGRGIIIIHYNQLNPFPLVHRWSMGLLQLVLLNLQVRHGHFWVQLSLAKGGVSIKKYQASVKTKRFSSRSRSTTCIYLIPTPIAPHLNIRLMPCYAMPWVFASVVSTRPPHRYWHYPSELRGQQSRPDDMGLWCWQLSNVCCEWNLHYINMKYSVWIAMWEILKGCQTHQHTNLESTNISMSKLGASIENKRSTLHHLAYSSSIQLLHPVSHHIIPNQRSLPMSLDQASRWPNSFFAKAFLGHHLTVMKGIEY